jgi:hypothetical protein
MKQNEKQIGVIVRPFSPLYKLACPSLVAATKEKTDGNFMSEFQDGWMESCSFNLKMVDGRAFV